MDFMATVSVVLAAWNAERFISATVESVLKQSFTDFELVAIDDGSTDQTASILSGFAARDSRIRVIQIPNGGVVAACNLGTKHSTGKYLAHIDADDIWHPHKLAAQVQFLERHPDHVLLGTAYGVIAEDDVPLRHFKRHYTEDGELRQRLPHECPFNHSSIIMRTEACRSAGGYRKVFEGAEDYDLWIRLSRLGKVANLPAVEVKYRRHVNQISNTRLEQQMIADLGVKLLAKRLDDGLDDPFASLPGPLTRRDLINVGVSPQAIDRHVLDGFELGARLLSEDGNRPGSLNLLSRAFGIAQKSSLAEDEIGRYGLMLSAAYVERRQLLSAIVTGLKVTRRSPLYPFKVLTRRFAAASPRVQ